MEKYITHEDQIQLAAQCLLGIHDEWDFFDIEQHLDWLLNNKEEIAEGYPMDVMNRECEVDIMNEVERILTHRAI